jgi:hypothetical protein
MLQCPVCQTEYAEGLTQFCTHCGWDLNELSPLLMGQLPAEYREAEHARLLWAQRMWAKLEASRGVGEKLDQLQQQLNHVTDLIQHQTEALSTQATSAPPPPPSPRPPAIDYNELKHLLKQQQWQQADWMTAKLMIAIAHRQKQGFLTEADLDHFPMRELRAINRLWLSASQGQFGFSLQKNITFELNSNRLAIAQVWPTLGQKLGWYDEAGDRWLTYQELDFSLNAPTGHLPVLGDGLIWFVSGWEGGSRAFAALMSRLDKCGI